MPLSSMISAVTMPLPMTNALIACSVGMRMLVVISWTCWIAAMIVLVLREVWNE